MRPAGILVVVSVVLVVLQTASAQETTSPRAPISTTTHGITTTFMCPQVTCMGGCQIATDYRGCPTCACPPSCEDVTCSNDEKCVLQEVNCFTIPCFPQPTCVARNKTTTSCPMIKCLPDCFPGTGSDGCPACDCPPTCQDANCAKAEECVLQVIYCFTVPCFPQPTCVPRREDSCSGTPSTKRCRRSTIRWFYNSSAGQCQRFRYYGCTPSPNTFLFRKSCERKCRRSVSPTCIALACDDNCYTVTRRNQCPRCICPNS